MGCAISLYTDSDWKRFLFACDYSYGNVIGNPVYLTGKTASGCKTGTNPKYPGLCSSYEVVSSSPYIWRTKSFSYKYHK